jgi:hypothetical protein
MRRACEAPRRPFAPPRPETAPSDPPHTRTNNQVQPSPAAASKPVRSALGPGVSSQQPVAGGIFKSAAVEVLRAERRLMSTGDITK